MKDSLPGISRKKKGKGFSYYSPTGVLITDPSVIKRINSLAIPPAYSNVWISPYPNGHIQATGRDERNRKQYIYHPLWREARQQKKFNTIIEFGKSLPKIRKHVDQQLQKPITLAKSQVIAAILYLLDNACVRIGTAIYAKENKSYGLTTLRKKHLSLEKNKAILEFTGKNAHMWHIILTHRKIIKILEKCEEIPGYELFKYKDDKGQINTITSQEVNGCLKDITKKPFTAKDFRTWTACRETFYRLVATIREGSPPTKDKLKETIGEVAQILGHTPSICQKNYIDPDIIAWWEGNQLQLWLKRRRLNIEEKEKIFLLWLKHKTR
ncbi:Eukaryotic DNA topoisomerase I, catalytic core (plasmid) [Legionella adelaidensis]|uniref:DNA topoisomerase n=1 Tax=Legionella adelaidensis TaxID=45056 RepID=A0A0W0R3E4_9GAMM|nr:DNA topoisomerase IB [Legionella adelaidensis]KTC65592.1 Eukaryotic DNA topoisomerase I, catalytic core [Legionella adelaidensis]VEH85211.1 Eukaryotic DNA topoisomerase I, catalytic core [Legionella adelaidensis]